MPRGSKAWNRSRSRSKTPARVPSRTAARPSALSASALNDSPKNRTKGYEWGGPAGALGMIIALPIIVVLLNTLCEGDGGFIFDYAQMSRAMTATFKQSILHLPIAFVLELAWLALNAVLCITPIGKRVDGMILRDGTILSYNINAMYVFLVIHVLVGGLNYAGIIHLAKLVDMFESLAIASIIISALMSLVVYIISFRSENVLLARGGNTGNHIYDFWIGRELNPRSGNLDWKFLCKLRPGLMGWSLLNWSFVAKSIETGNCTPSIIIIALLESFYVFDALLSEADHLTTVDIAHDGFGFLSCFRDLAWVPFTYTLKTKFLAYHKVKLGNVCVALCCTMAAVGYVILRKSNSRKKSAFSQSPRSSLFSKLNTLKTAQGDSLFVSRFWDVCRHPHYVGECLFTFSCSALTGMTSFIPYVHPVLFAVLAIRRQHRDEQYMREKCTEAEWRKFTKNVRYRLIPYVY